jgi:hypothetical protein
MSLMHQDDICAAKDKAFDAGMGAEGSVTEGIKTLGHVTDHERRCE